MKCATCQLDLQPEAFYPSNKRNCKECVKAQVRANRAANVQHYRAHDRARANDPKRVAARLEYQAENKAIVNAAKRRWAAKNYAKKKAAVAVNNAVRDGRLVPLPCWHCGSEKVEAHHPDYSAPLDIIWLCGAAHKQLHREHRARLRGE